MTYKKINLFFIAVIIIIIFCTLPANNDWLYTKIIDPGNNVFDQPNHMGIDERKASRYGYSYLVYLNILHKVDNPKQAVILLPPIEYVKSIHVNNFAIPEPATFYYYTGLEAVWANSPHVGLANWEVVVKGEQQIGLRRIPGKEHLDSVLTFYRKYLQ